MSSTSDNVMAAFAGESQANRKYLFFAEQAEKDGFRQVARLFRAAADAETAHARNHLKAAGGIGSTKENLEAAVGGEHHEFTQMYPGFIKEAESEGADKAKESFALANTVEEIHHGLFTKYLEQVDSGRDVAEVAVWVCQYCGNTVEGEPPDKCPVCGAPKKMFKNIE